MKNNHRQSTIEKRMTLIEIVVVLGIMAAVASVVLGSLVESAENERYDSNYQTMKSIRDAVCGTKEPDGISRFLSDMGRLPIVINTVDDGKILTELFSKEEVENYYSGNEENNGKWTNVEFSLSNCITFPTDSNLSFPDKFTDIPYYCGWRGPYINVLSTTFKDAWNNNWRVAESSDDTETGDIMNYIVSDGSNTTYNDDDDVEWHEKNQSLQMDYTTPSLVVNVMVRDDSGTTPIMRNASGTEDLSGYSGWTPDTSYSTSSAPIVEGGFLYKVKTIPSDSTTGTGKSGLATAKPTFLTSYKSLTVDNEIVWECIYPEPNHIKTVNVALFSPYVEKGETNILMTSLNQNSSSHHIFNLVTSSGTIEVKTADGNEHDPVNLVPGHRKLFAWSYYETTNSTDDTVYVNKFCSDVIDITLKPGSNHVTLYLVNELEEE